ncbi:ral guanine nucleotide dissociation stimulator-like isoform X1 [Equus przewalskii]|uniref:Ral guanine nucleotide dissociation stimulator-like isoform X1 n=1 Tax=Equus przewalskii TaxID=9798 RepID=A0ABM4M8Y4_EQUPR
MVRHKGPSPNESALGGQCGSKGQASHPVAHLPPPSTIYLMLGSWLDQGQDFSEPLQFPCLTVKLATVHVSSGGSDPEGQACLLPGHLEHLMVTETEQKEPPPKLLPLPEPEPEPAPAPGLEPAPPPVPSPVVELEPASPVSATARLEEGPPLKSAPVSAPALETTGRWALLRLPVPSAAVRSPQDPAPEPTCPWAVTTEDQLREEKPNLLDFSPQLVAEQLMRMAAVSSRAHRAGGPCLPGAMSHPTPAIPCSRIQWSGSISLLPPLPTL